MVLVPISALFNIKITLQRAVCVSQLIPEDTSFHSASQREEKGAEMVAQTSSVPLCAGWGGEGGGHGSS